MAVGDWRFIASRGRLESLRRPSFILEGSKLCRCDVLAKVEISVLVGRNRKKLARPLFFSRITEVGRKRIEKVGASIFFLSRGLILAVVSSRSVFDLLHGQVSSNRCDYSSRMLRNVEGRLTRVVAVMTASFLQIRASSMLIVFRILSRCLSLGRSNHVLSSLEVLL